MPDFEVNWGAESLAVMKELSKAITLLLKDIHIRLKAQSPSAENWLTASHFCETYDISRATLDRRVKTGSIEKKEFDDDMLRYRWAEEDKRELLK